jgi:hypothetical protein
MMDQARLKDLLEFDRATGGFRWRVTNSNRAKAGSSAGCIRSDGYVTIRLDGVKHLAHRLAWLYECGFIPTGMLDHINGDRSDNRIENLREASNSLNQQNRKMSSRNTTGVVGVTKRKYGRWRASITVGKKFISLGSFATKEEAEAAYLNAKKKYHETMSYDAKQGMRVICGDCDELMIEEDA